jgi:hypothetical protein
MSKTDAKSKSKAGAWIKPGFVLAAITLAWAAANTPPDFSAANILIWLTGMLTTALIAKAAMAIIEPAIKLSLRTARRQIREANRARHAAGKTP